MSSKIFLRLRKRLTLQYTLVFTTLILLVVFAAYAFTWWSILAIKKQELHAKAIHEGEEWISSREMPCNDNEVASASMLAYFVGPDQKAIIVNQLGPDEVGQTILAKKADWPKFDGRHTNMLRTHAANSQHYPHYRYLATVCAVKDGDKLLGYLYMFENMETYYQAGFRTLRNLALLFLCLFSCACLGSYYLAKRSIDPICQAYEQQKQFTADASHEMRTPLAVMKLAVQGMAADEDSKLSTFSQDTLTMLEQEVDRLSRLTESLMTLARSDNDTYALPLTAISMDTIILRVANQLQLLASKKDIAIQRHLESDVTVLGDEASLERLCIILVDNAIKYSPDGTDINLSLTKVKNFAVLKVADQGIGIKDEDKVKIFDRFYRVDKARSRSMGGLGLGLSLAKAIVEHHHGSITVEDNQAQGTIMTVKLPLTK